MRVFHLAPMTLQGLPARIVAKIKIDPVTQCWRWQGSIEHHGYGRVKFEGKPRYIHSVVWLLLRGRMPRRTTQLDHTCEQHECCNPRHLEPVTASTNLRRSRCWHHLVGRRRSAA